MNTDNKTSDWSGTLAAILTFAFWLLVFSIETQSLAARAAYNPRLGAPAWGHIYWPWQDLIWMAQLDFFGGEKVKAWVHAWFAAQRSQLAFWMIASVVLSLAIQWYYGRRAAGRAHGNAEWASANDVRRSKMYGNRDGIILGQTLERLGAKGDLLIHAGTENVLALGPPGVGKTDGIVVSTLLKSWPYWSAIVFDPAGELVERTAERRAHHTRVLTFDPRSETSSCYNPLSGLKPHDVDAVRAVVASYLLDRDFSEMSEQEQFFASSSVELATAVTAHVMELGTPTLPHAAAYYYNTQWETDKQVCESLLKSEIPYVAEAGSKFARMSDKQLSPIMATFSTRFNEFRTPDVARALGGSDFSSGDLRNQATTLYLTCRETDQAALNPVMRMVLTRLLDDLTVEIPAEGEQPILLLVDEFPLLRAPVIARKLATMRKYLIRAALLAQSYTQIRSAYGMNEAISGLCDVRVFFPSMDAATQDLASRSCGEATRWGYATAATAGGTPSTSAHETGRPLLLPNELADLAATGEIVITVKGERPIRARVVRAHADPRFASRVGDTADSSDLNDIIESMNAIIANFEGDRIASDQEKEVNEYLQAEVGAVCRLDRPRSRPGRSA